MFQSLVITIMSWTAMSVKVCINVDSNVFTNHVIIIYQTGAKRTEGLFFLILKEKNCMYFVESDQNLRFTYSKNRDRK